MLAYSVTRQVNPIVNFHDLRANQRVWDLMTFSQDKGKQRPEGLGEFTP